MRSFALLCLYLFTAAFLLGTQHSIAQMFSISGHLTENGSGTPVAGAQVQLLNQGHMEYTDANGNFYFTELLPDTYRLSISYWGYQQLEQTVVLNGDAELNLALKSAMVDLEEVTVSPKKSISQTESISGMDKLLRPVNTAQDLLQLVPGLIIAQHAGGGKAEQIFLRGFDCDHGTDFNISVDGLPVNMVSHAHGQGYADFHFVIPETVDRLKVYKGPYTTQFGDFATSGTGQFFTKNSIEGNQLKAEAGLFDTYRALGMFTLLDKKHFLTKRKEDAYLAAEYVFTNSYFNEKQGLNRYNLLGKYSAWLNGRNYLNFSLSTFAAGWDASGQVPQRSIDDGAISRFGSIDPTEGGQTSRSNANIVLTSSFGNRAVLRNQAYFTSYHFKLYSNFTFYLSDSVHGDQINQVDDRMILGYKSTYEQGFSIGQKQLQTTIGLGTRNDFAEVSLRHAEKRTILDTLRLGELYQQNAHAFADAVIELTHHLTLNVGSRVDLFYFHYRDHLEDELSGNKSALRVSPKLNFYYVLNDRLQFFLKSGMGFHSNDARAVVVNNVRNSLPRAYGSEIGSEFKPARRILVNVALWELYLQSELVYIGDEGTVETNNPTNRIGIDLSVRYQFTDHLFADADLNVNHGRLLHAAEKENYIPLAPGLTSIGGVSYKQEKGVNAGLRYRFIDDRPANETNSVTAHGYFLLDAVFLYKFSKLDIGLSAENLLNTSWNQAQFDTESRLANEAVPVSELHFTPGTPFFLKGMINCRF